MKALVGFVILLFVLVSCQDQASKKPTVRTTFASLDSNNYYVGIETCASCHQEHFNGFKHTGMGLSYESAHQGKSLIPVNDTLHLRDESLDFQYDIFWIDSVLYSLEYRMKENDTVHQLLMKVDDVIGSGHHTNSHIQNRNGYAYQMPFTFYVQDSLLDLPPGFDKGSNSRFFRQIDIECMSCHNSYPEHVKGSTNKFKNIPEGINCERCHGPGGLHVEEKKNGGIVDVNQEIDYSIVNPGKLELDLQFSICQRCHLQGNTVLEEGKSFYDFVPGMSLKDVMSVYLPRYEGQSNDFIMASHVDRLQMSSCFIKSKAAASADSLYPTKGQLTCITCHNPHKSVKSSSYKSYDAACNSCHAEKKCGVNEIENCASCHMPKSSAIDIPHVSITDHFIKKKHTTESSTKSVFKGLVAVNNTNPSERSKLQAYLNQYDKFDSDPILLDSAVNIADKMNPNEANIHALVQLYYTQQDSKSMLSLIKSNKVKEILKGFKQSTHENYEAWTLFRIGDLLADSGIDVPAAIYLAKACELAPYILEFKNKLASLKFRNEEQLAAKNMWLEILIEDSLHYQSWSNLAYVNMTESKWEDARKCLDFATLYNPDYIKAWENYYLLGQSLQDAKLMRKALEEVVRLNPENIQAKQLLKSLR